MNYFPEGSSLLDSDYRFGFAPEFIELIVVPLGLAEGVDDDVAIVEDQPARAWGTLAVRGDDTLWFQGLFNFVDDGF